MEFAEILNSVLLILRSGVGPHNPCFKCFASDADTDSWMNDCGKEKFVPNQVRT